VANRQSRGSQVWARTVIMRKILFITLGFISGITMFKLYKWLTTKGRAILSVYKYHATKATHDARDILDLKA